MSGTPSPLRSLSNPPVLQEIELESQQRNLYDSPYDDPPGPGSAEPAFRGTNEYPTAGDLSGAPLNDVEGLPRDVSETPLLHHHDFQAPQHSPAVSFSKNTRPGGGVLGYNRDSPKSMRPGASRASSADNTKISRGKLGNWLGPAGGNSPYGPMPTVSGSEEKVEMQDTLKNSYKLPENLQFAEGDFYNPTKHRFGRFLVRIYNLNFIVRWMFIILPVLALLWIPGIVGVCVKDTATIWSVKLVWWSCWLTIVWVGWWGCSLVALVGPVFLYQTVGFLSTKSKQYLLYQKAIRLYSGACGWSLVNWVTFLTLINRNAIDNHSSNTLSLCTQGLFGVFVCCDILFIIKLVVQVIAHSFHKRSYEARLEEQRAKIQILTVLYLHSRDIGRRDTLDGQRIGSHGRSKQSIDPTKMVKKALKGARRVAQTATTVLGTVASEMAGERVLQPNSPHNMVLSILSSEKKTKHLARRIYFSYTPLAYRDAMLVSDISKLFHTMEEAEEAFSIFDRDENGDATLDEIELSLQEIHRERVALTLSMKDIDSAVGRLDRILVTLWYFVSIIIIIGLLNSSFNTFIASAGTFILGLSWCINTTAQEILTSFIFLFIKHLYDVDDRIEIDGVSYTVLEMHLLSSVFRRSDGVTVGASHLVLSTKFISNHNRSKAISEPFAWDVAFDTPFAKIEKLTEMMKEFLLKNKRDYRPEMNIVVSEIEGQGKLALTADIMYKSNAQNLALKSQRRNKWVCALKDFMSELQIYGPGDQGNPAPAPPDPVPYTLVPYEKYEHDVLNPSLASPSTTL